MAKNKNVYLKDIEIKPLYNIRSQYVKNKDKYINRMYNYLYVKDIVVSTKGYALGVCDCTRCGEKDLVIDISSIVAGRRNSCNCVRKAGMTHKSIYDSPKYIGNIYGDLRVDEAYTGELGGHKGVIWKTTCLRCGNTKEIIASLLVNGTVKSCGCKGKERNNKYSNPEEWVGKIINGTKVLEIGTKSADGQHWICQCKYCGKPFDVIARRIAYGVNRSCGCSNPQNSLGIQEICEYLDTRNIIYEREWKHPNLLSKLNYPLRVDVALKDKNNKVIGLIEYNGMQHYSSQYGFGTDFDREVNFDKLVDSDNRKREFARKYNIPLLEIVYSRYSTEIIYTLSNFIKMLEEKGEIQW